METITTLDQTAEVEVATLPFRERVRALYDAINTGLTCIGAVQVVEDYNLPYSAVECIVTNQPFFMPVDLNSSIVNQCAQKVGLSKGYSVLERTPNGVIVRAPAHWNAADWKLMMTLLIENEVVFSINSSGQFVVNV